MTRARRQPGASAPVRTRTVAAPVAVVCRANQTINNPLPSAGGRMRARIPHSIMQGKAEKDATLPRPAGQIIADIPIRFPPINSARAWVFPTAGVWRADP